MNVSICLSYVSSCLSYVSVCLSCVGNCLSYVSICLFYVSICLSYVSICPGAAVTEAVNLIALNMKEPHLALLIVRLAAPSCLPCGQMLAQDRQMLT